MRYRIIWKKLPHLNRASGVRGEREGRKGGANVGFFYYPTHVIRLIGDRSMHGARTCSSVQQCLELQVSDGIAGWRKNISHYSTRDFCLI